MEKWNSRRWCKLRISSPCCCCCAAAEAKVPVEVENAVRVAGAENLCSILPSHSTATVKFPSNPASCRRGVEVLAAVFCKIGHRRVSFCRRVRSLLAGILLALQGAGLARPQLQRIAPPRQKRLGQTAPTFKLPHAHQPSEFKACQKSEQLHPDSSLTLLPPLLPLFLNK